VVGDVGSVSTLCILQPRTTGFSGWTYLICYHDGTRSVPCIQHLVTIDLSLELIVYLYILLLFLSLQKPSRKGIIPVYIYIPIHVIGDCLAQISIPVLSRYTTRFSSLAALYLKNLHKPVILSSDIFVGIGLHLAHSLAVCIEHVSASHHAVELARALLLRSFALLLLQLFLAPLVDQRGALLLHEVSLGLRRRDISHVVSPSCV
jgi:hypothetical protein